jgi:Na+/H+ antiporter NhaC
MRKLVDEIDEFVFRNVMLCALILFFFIRFVLQFGKPSPNLALFIEMHLVLALGFCSENGSKEFHSSVKHLDEGEEITFTSYQRQTD